MMSFTPLPFPACPCTHPYKTQNDSSPSRNTAWTNMHFEETSWRVGVTASLRGSREEEEY